MSIKLSKVAYNRRDEWPTFAEIGGLDSPKYTNIGLALNQELNISINPKTITYRLVNNANIKYYENNEGNKVFIKNYDGNVIDYRNYIDSDYLDIIDVEENYSQTNE